MFEDLQNLFTTPFSTLAMIAAGYLSYRIAYTGKDQLHGQIDVVFFVCVFAFIANGASLAILATTEFSAWFAAVAGVVVSLLLACLWARSLSRRVAQIMFKLGINNSQRYRGVWDELKARTDLIFSDHHHEEQWLSAYVCRSTKVLW